MEGGEYNRLMDRLRNVTLPGGSLVVLEDWEKGKANSRGDFVERGYKYLEGNRVLAWYNRRKGR